MSKMSTAIAAIEDQEKAAEMMERIIKMAPFRIILKCDAEGKLQGLCENSFSMSWESNRVLIFWSGKAYSMLGEHELDAQKNAEHNRNKPDEAIYDPFSDECPIEIDWVRWLNATSKYDQRNAHFTVLK